jgi:hypothetical protein
LDLHGIGDDPDLAHILRVWPSLPQHTRDAILALIENTAPG